MSKRNKNEHGARTQEQIEVYERLFKGIPVVDATSDIRVAVLDIDADGATRGDPENCALARACKRQFGTQDALFFRRRAYVAIPDEDGNLRVERFMISAKAYDLLRDFDLKGTSRSGGAFVMRAPRKSETLEGQRQRDRNYRQAVIRGERVVGEKQSEASKKGLRNRSMVVGKHSLRDGAGMVHFVEAEL